MGEKSDGVAVLKSIGLWGGASALGVGLAAGAVGVSAAAAVGAAVVGGLATGFVVLVRAFKR
jgi:hypothetical protein